MQMTHEDSVNLTRAINKLTKQLSLLSNQLSHCDLKNCNVSDKSTYRDTHRTRFNKESIRILRGQIHSELHIIKAIVPLDSRFIHNDMWHLINTIYVFTHIITLSNDSYMSPLNSLVHSNDTVATYCKYMKPYIDSKDKRLVSVKSLSEIRHGLIRIINRYLHHTYA